MAQGTTKAMSMLHRCAIRKSCVELVEQLQPSAELYDHLIESNVLLPHHVQRIKAISRGVIRDEIRMIIYEYLPRRDDTAYMHFLEALRKTSQDELADAVIQNEHLLHVM